MPENQSESSRERLKGLLRELFQFDLTDLDFGIYRIMNQRRDDIERFIEKDLITRTEEAFKEYVGTSTKSLQNELKELKDKINKDFGAGTIDEFGEVEKNKDAPKVLEYLGKREELRNAELTQGQIDDVYNRVYEFFSRYYDNGDFLSKRRRGGREKYVVPYEGEEVVLHWANKDQYYVKTAENFSNYEFKADGWNIKFVIVKAEVDQTGLGGKNRYFILSEEHPPLLNSDSKDFIISFQYRGLTDNEERKYSKNKRQEQISDCALEHILQTIKGSPIESTLTKTTIVREEKQSLLVKHITKYVKKNSSDYFIHKNLKDFLSRELDFYLTNEVFQLDELVESNERIFKQKTARLRAIREICLSIISFLAQIENFQKTLFEIKKFILRTEYCFTLDNIPKEFYPEIASNKEQVSEWKRLFRLDDITEGTLEPTKGSDELTVEFLEGHSNLVLDTKYFNQRFKDRLLESFNDLDELIGGLLIKSENWQALNLISERYREQIKCVYIDPPYNTGNDDFIYKDKFQHSCWLTSIFNRVALSLKMLESQSSYWVSIDDNEVHRLKELLDNTIGNKEFNSIIPVINNLKGRNDRKNIATIHEYLLFYEIGNFNTYGITFTDEKRLEFKNEDEKGNKYQLRDLRKRGRPDRREDRPKMWFPIYYNEKEKTFSLERKSISDIEITPKKSDGSDGRWRWGKKKVAMNLDILNTHYNNISNKWEISHRVYLESDDGEKRMKPKSVWSGSKYSTDIARRTLLSIIPDSKLDYPKATGHLEDIISMSVDDEETILDFFAGSGTTAHALINLNKIDDGNRKYILIEMGQHFDYILKPRIEKILFSEEWDAGVPKSYNGYSHVFKYIELEQYDDALCNIIFNLKDRMIQETLENYNDYFLRYFLDYETCDSPSKLAVDDFSNPFDYKIKTVNREGEPKQSVDLVETFNYLIGLHVKRIEAKSDGERYYKIVRGNNPDNKSVIIIWRDTNKIDLKRDKEFIENEFLKDAEPNIIYVNGICHVDGALPIEPDFKKYMGVR